MFLIKEVNMLFEKDPKKLNFVSIAIFFIFVGIGIFTYGIVAWIFNVYNQETLIAFPSVKVIGGALVMLLAYIQLELEYIRKK